MGFSKAIREGNTRLLTLQGILVFGNTGVRKEKHGGSYKLDKASDFFPV